MTDVTELRSAAVGAPNKVDITPVIEVIMVSAAELAGMRYTVTGSGKATGCQGPGPMEATLVQAWTVLGVARLRPKGLSGAARLRVGQGSSLLRQRLRVGLALRASGIVIFSVCQWLRITLG